MTPEDVLRERVAALEDTVATLEDTIERLTDERTAAVRVLEGEGNFDEDEPLRDRIAAVISDAIPGPRYTPAARDLLLERVSRAEKARWVLQARVAELLDIGQRRWDTHRDRVDNLMDKHDRELAWTAMGAWCDGLRAAKPIPPEHARLRWLQESNKTRLRLLEQVGAAVLAEVEGHLQVMESDA